MTSLKAIYVWRTLEFLTVLSIAYIFLKEYDLQFKFNSCEPNRKVC